ncbi:MAG: LrgB family protein [Treponema sp.]|nr:LrgB family protein [Treponema sp.]
MSDFLANSAFFGLFLTLATFCFSIVVYQKTKFFLFSPLLLSSALCIASLVLFRIPYESYKEGATIIHSMLTPVTVALAVPLYKQFQKLKENWVAILVGIMGGIVANAISIFVLCLLFKIGHTEYVSLLPKSITTAIALAITEQNGGIVSVTILMVTISGNIANIFAVQLARLFRITEPVAKGVAIGTSGHALGTARALQMGEVEGSMSGLSIAVCGVLTVVVLPFFVGLIK